MKKKAFLALCILVIMICSIALVACTGAYAMDEFIVDFSKLDKEYEVGDTVDLSKLGISAKFNDGTTEVIPLDKVTILLDGKQIGLDELSKITETAGKKTLEIKYSDIVKSIEIVVNEKHIPVLTGVELVVDANVTTEYIIGEAVSFAGVKVNAVYDNGASKKEIALNDENLTIFMDQEIITGNYNRITEEVGAKVIKVKYTVFTCEDSLTINVADEMDAVRITLPDDFKTAYKVGDVISLADIKAAAYYKSGKKVDIEEIKYYLGNDEVDFAALTATTGPKTVVAKAVSGDMVGTKDIAFTVENFVTDISLDTTGVILNYIVDEEISAANFAGIKVNVTYADPADNKEIALTAEGVSCLNAAEETFAFADLTNTAGEKVVTVSYGGQTTTFTVTVTDGETALESLTVTAPDRTAYTAGETGITFAGLAITAQYKAEYGKEDEIIGVDEFAEKNVKVFFIERQLTDFDDVAKVASIGNNQQFSVQVRYEGKTASFDITVTNAVVTLSVDASNAKVAYKVDEAVDFSGLDITATLNFGTKKIAYNANDVSYFDGTTNNINDFTKTPTDSKAITVSFGGQTDSFVISVEDYITGISFGTLVTFGADVDLTPGAVYTFPDLQVYADYKSGAKVLLNTGYTFSNNTIGVPTSGKTVTVSCGEFTNNVTLVVYDVLQSIVVTDIPTFAYGTDAAATLANITVRGTYTYKDQVIINIMQQDGESFLYGLVSFAMMDELSEYQTLSQLDLNQITASSGTKNLRVTISENAHSVSYDFSVTVTAPAPGVDEFSLPESIVLYNSTKTTSQSAQSNINSQAFESAYFVDGTEEYLVGDDNVFKFVPRLLQVNLETESVTELTTYQTTSKVYYEGNALTETVVGSKKQFSLGGELMVEENFMQNTFDFTTAAIGRSFKLSVLPSAEQFDYDAGDFSAVEWTVKIVDGYNITDSKELCLLEQSSRTLWNGIKGELGLTGVRPNSIILHQNTIVTKDSIPSAMYYTLPDSYNIKYKYSDSAPACRPEDVPAEYGGPLSRTFLWDGEWPIFEYDMIAGSSFTFYGNFFDLNMTNMPLVAAFEPAAGTVNVPDTNGMSGTYYGSYMSKVSFLEVRGIEGTTANSDETFNFSNFAVKGNAAINQVLVDGSSNIEQGEDSPVFGGGLIFVKTRYCTANIVNIHAHACFIPFYSRNETVVNYTNAKAYDSFQNALFVNCDSVNHLTNCHFKRAGGPLMILVENTKKVNDVDVKLVPKVYADNDCVLESIVTGQSQWFVTYGVTGNVAQLAALDPLLNGYFERSIINDGKFNVIAVSIENGGGGTAGTQAYMSYKNNAINRIDGQGSFETTKALAGYGFFAFFLMGDVICAPYTTDFVNYSLVNSSMGDCATDMTVQGAFRNPSNQYVVIYAGGMGILAQLY